MNKFTCVLAECDQPVHIKKHGYCRTHYNRWWRTGSTGAPIDATNACTACNAPFKSQQPNAMYCGEPCREAANVARARSRYVPRDHTEETCTQCGATYMSKMASRLYCSRRCRNKAVEERETRTCTIAGCSNRLHARGLCKTHYNATRPNRIRKVEVPCDECGKRSIKELRAKRYDYTYCTIECRDTARRRATRLRQSQVTAYKPTPLWHTAHRSYTTASTASRVFISASCIICHTPFLDLYGARTCGGECQGIHHRNTKREAEHRRRAREKNAYVSPVNRTDVYRRDNFTCQLCDEPLHMDEASPHPLSPSIDHIIPLARGGTHEPSNVQAAHFICNAVKGDRAWPTVPQRGRALP